MDNFENKTPGQEPESDPKKAEDQKTGEAQGAPKVEPQKVYYRPSNNQQDSQQYQDRGQYGSYQQDPRYVPQGSYQQPVQTRRGMPSWLKAILIIVLVFVLLIYLMSSCVSSIGKTFNSTVESTGLMETGADVTTADATGEYIGVIHVEGTISEDGASAGYNHDYILKSIEDMSKDDNNKGIILYLDTPGGTVFASDEVYFAIKDYQEKAKRPVYASMQSMAASGGYYISAPCDKIYANRNCFTGSIGVTMGQVYDVTELMDKLGIKATAITAGRNKAMGSYTQEFTEEQKSIYQSLVDEAYDQFTGIVSEERNMDIKKVRELADGRVYTARQAKENGLIDEIGTYKECVDAMKADYALGADIQVLDFWPAESTDLMSLLSLAADNIGSRQSVIPTADQIRELAELNDSFKLMYIAE